jgi:hypothetical protein
LFLNLEDLIRRHGVERIAFHTQTFAENLRSRNEAQRRHNSYTTNFLRHHVVEYVSTVERQLRGAIHYHNILAFPYDVRSGFDFASAHAATAAYKSGDVAGRKAAMARVTASANDKLRAWWTESKSARPRFGFGRDETLPVLSNAAAVSRYVGGYVGAEWNNRKPEDKGLRTIRYGLKRRAASIRWTWAAGNGQLWRKGCAVLGAVLGTEEFAETLGKRWAYNWREEIAAFGRHWERCLAFTHRTLADETDFVDRLGFAVRMAETVIEIEKSKQQKGQNAN